MLPFATSCVYDGAGKIPRRRFGRFLLTIGFRYSQPEVKGKLVYKYKILRSKFSVISLRSDTVVITRIFPRLWKGNLFLVIIDG